VYGGLIKQTFLIACASFQPSVILITGNPVWRVYGRYNNRGVCQ